jgi:hypothetical protein
LLLNIINVLRENTKGGSAMKTILVTGYAPVPKGTPMYEVYKSTGVILEIDPETNIIVDADFPFITELGKDFFRRLTRGYCMEKGIDALIERIYQHFFTPSTDAVVKALRTAYQRYTQTAKPKYFNQHLSSKVM